MIFIILIFTEKMMLSMGLHGVPVYCILPRYPKQSRWKGWPYRLADLLFGWSAQLAVRLNHYEQMSLYLVTLYGVYKYARGFVEPCTQGLVCVCVGVRRYDMSNQPNPRHYSCMGGLTGAVHVVFTAVRMF